MALTPEQRKQIMEAAYRAHAEGRPLFPPRKPAQAIPQHQELSTLSDETIRKIKDAAIEAHKAGKPLFAPRTNTPAPVIPPKHEELRARFRALEGRLLLELPVRKEGEFD